MAVSCQLPTVVIKPPPPTTDQIDFFSALLQLVTASPPSSLGAQFLGEKGEVMAEESGSWFCVLVLRMNLY